MYDLTVEEAHTFAVGDGEWVVHNECDARGYYRIPESSDFHQRALELRKRYQLETA